MTSRNYRHDVHLDVGSDQLGRAINKIGLGVIFWIVILGGAGFLYKKIAPQTDYSFYSKVDLCVAKEKEALSRSNRWASDYYQKRDQRNAIGRKCFNSVKPSKGNYEPVSMFKYLDGPERSEYLIKWKEKHGR